MSKITSKVAAVATTLAMAASMLSYAPAVHAQTACSVGTVDLTVGSSGAAVTCLQQMLIAAGYSIPAGATGYFGQQTKSAVMAWQAAAGITPAAGYFGPISRSHWGMSTGGTGSTGGTSTVPGCMPGAMFSSTTGASCFPTSTVPGCVAGAMFSSTTGAPCSGGSTGTTGLTGSGRLTNVSSYGDVDSDIKEGDSATGVVGVSADATSGDVAIQRVDATFTISNSGGSSNLSKYVSDVSLYLDGTKLASMDPSMGDKDGRVWTLRFSGLNGVIKNGKTGNLVVKVTPVSSIGSDENGDSITAKLDVDSVRAVGADGISDTYVGTAISESFTVSAATDGTLTVSAGSDNPKASQIAVSSSTTTGVKLLTFSLKAKNQDVDVTDLAIQLGTSDNNLNDVISNVKLMKGSTVLSSKTVSTGTFGTTTFTNVNETISKDSTENYWISADIKGDASYADGTTLVASTTVYGWDVSDSEGATVTPSAAAVGNTMTLTATGVSIVHGTMTAVNAAANYSGGVDTATYTIPFTVTAGDSDVYVSGVATRGTGSGTGIRYGTTTTSTFGATGNPTATVSVADSLSGDSAGSYYKITANTSRTFTLTVALTASSTGVTAGFAGVQLNSVEYGQTTSLGSSYTSNLDTFKTDNVYVQKH